jgi:hypothetical protein
MNPIEPSWRDLWVFLAISATFLFAALALAVR